MLTFIFCDFFQAFSNKGQVFSRVVPLLNIQPTLHVDYTATDADLDLLTPHQASLDELGISSSQWDPLNGPAPGVIAGKADLVVCNHAWGPMTEDAEVLVRNLSSGAKQGGFLLLHTLLKGETLGETLSFICSSTLNGQKGLLTQVGVRMIFFVCLSSNGACCKKFWRK